MQTEQFYDLLLDFGEDWAVREVLTGEASDEVEIAIEYVGSRKPYDHAPLRRWRHLNTMQYKSYIVCRLPRFKDAAGKVETLCPPWAERHERHTLLFEQVVILLLQATGNQTQTAKLLDCSFDVVNRIMHNATKRGLERRQLDGGIVAKYLGIDEKSFRKGHHYITVLSNGETGQVLDVAEGRKTESCKALLEKVLPLQWQRDEVKTITMDMWKAFIKTAQEMLPDADIVHDYFHIIQYFNKAIDSVRRREVKTQSELKGARYSLLKNPENLTIAQQDVFDMVMQANVEAGDAWQARENFKEAVKLSSTNDCKALFEQWYDHVKERGIREVVKVADMLNNHREGILNAMKSTFNNARAERTNGKIQQLKSIGRGYRTFENFRSAILFFHGGLDVLPLNCR